jgi:hypothetical protein
VSTDEQQRLDALHEHRLLTAVSFTMARGLTWVP